MRMMIPVSLPFSQETTADNLGSARGGQDDVVVARTAAPILAAPDGAIDGELRAGRRTDGRLRGPADAEQYRSEPGDQRGSSWSGSRWEMIFALTTCRSAMRRTLLGRRLAVGSIGDGMTDFLAP